MPQKTSVFKSERYKPVSPEAGAIFDGILRAAAAIHRKEARKREPSNPSAGKDLLIAWLKRHKPNKYWVEVAACAYVRATEEAVQGVLCRYGWRNSMRADLLECFLRIMDYSRAKLFLEHLPAGIRGTAGQKILFHFSEGEVSEHTRALAFSDMVTGMPPHRLQQVFIKAWREGEASLLQLFLERSQLDMVRKAAEASPPGGELLGDPVFVLRLLGVFPELKERICRHVLAAGSSLLWYDNNGATVSLAIEHKQWKSMSGAGDYFLGMLTEALHPGMQDTWDDLNSTDVHFWICLLQSFAPELRKPLEGPLHERIWMRTLHLAEREEWS